MLALLILCIAAASVEGQQRIVGGSEATPHSFPWQASLRRLTTAGDGTVTESHFCGAVVISSRYVLTAAHCIDVYDAKDTKVVVGGHSINNPSQYQQEAMAVRLIKHENYDANKNGFPNDIGLVEVDTPFVENDGVKFAKLPSNDNNDYTQNDGCRITGWGLTIGGSSSSRPDVLQVTPTKVITNSACASKLGFFVGLYLTGNHICVDGEGQSSACNGDSGGPATCDVNNETFVVGVTSWGLANCPTNSPSVYTRLSKYLPWISGNSQ